MLSIASLPVENILALLSLQHYTGIIAPMKLLNDEAVWHSVNLHTTVLIYTYQWTFLEFDSTLPNPGSGFTYRIALNFWGSKFSRIATFEDFVEIISRTRCTRTQHAACQKFTLKYFRERLKICEIREIKDPRKFSAIRYMLISNITSKNWLYNTELA